ncbi:MAG: tRNA pseudouridine(55) synthase TruB [Bryobacteraceae bacterium]|nr:tRNA pseudouridine(55) synthase TruB [Bryobacteraceae bacterium]
MRSNDTRPSAERPGDKLVGAVVVDKPAGWTSHDVVNKVRRFAGTRKVGHLGTLDPNATGVLPLLLGRATRLAQYFGKAEKKYEGVVYFGYATDTWDSQGKATTEAVECTPSASRVEEALQSFRGSLKQVPPPVSAKKVGGVPAYKLARANKPVALPPVDVEIFSLELTEVEGSTATLRIHCSAGTYIRSIAHELGAVFGCGSHLQSLRRTASGEFTLKDARTLEDLEKLFEQGRFSEALVDGANLLEHFPAEIVDEPTMGFIRQGRDFRTSPFRSLGDADYIRAIGPGGELVAIGQIRLPNVYRPVLVL